MKKNRTATLAIALGLIASIAPAYAIDLPTGTTTAPADVAETSPAPDRNAKPAADFNQTRVDLDAQYCRMQEARETILETCVEMPNSLTKPYQRMLARIGSIILQVR